MSASLVWADVVLVGEQHDDPNTHRLELAVLEGLARRKRSVIVSMEMFERDVQDPLDHFQMGHLAEDEFLKQSRPWPRYVTDYKPLVDFAIARDWPIVAGERAASYRLRSRQGWPGGAGREDRRRPPAVREGSRVRGELVRISRDSSRRWAAIRRPVPPPARRHGPTSATSRRSA
jgi:hypothetical protein